MSFTPLILTDDEINSLSASETVPEEVPSKTYSIDFDTGEILASFVDGSDAIVQAAQKAIMTMRDNYLIYSSDYGCEIFDLLGYAYSDDYLQIEVPRLISEALMDDDRIVDTQEFVITRDGSSLDVSFYLITELGDTLQVEVTI